MRLDCGGATPEARCALLSLSPCGRGSHGREAAPCGMSDAMVRAKYAPNQLLPDELIDLYAQRARDPALRSSEINQSEFPAVWGVLQQNSAIQSHYVNAAVYGQGHSGQVTSQVSQMRKMILAAEPPPKVVCESGFNAGHSAVIWLEGTSVHLHSFDLGVEPYSKSSQAFIHRMYPGRMTYHRGDSSKTMRLFADAVERGTAPKCDFVFIDGNHARRGPWLDLQYAFLASRDGAVVIADDCTSRFPAVPRAWHFMLGQRYIRPMCPSAAGFALLPDGSTSAIARHKLAPGQPKPFNFTKKGKQVTVSQVIGMKGWCVGKFTKPSGPYELFMITNLTRKHMERVSEIASREDFPACIGR